MVPEKYSDLARAVALQIASFPDREAFIVRRFKRESAEALSFADDVASSIAKLSVDELPRVFWDYRWLKGQVYC